MKDLGRGNDRARQTSRRKLYMIYLVDTEYLVHDKAVIDPSENEILDVRYLMEQNLECSSPFSTVPIAYTISRNRTVHHLE